MQSNEPSKTVDEMLILDVDGPITDPGEKRPTIDGNLNAIIERLEKNEPVALNTGRSVSWIIERVITPLILKINNKKYLHNLFAVGEKGGTWLTFTETGEITQHRDESISVPTELQDRIRTLVAKEFLDTTFFDESKLTMVSTEMRDSVKDKMEELYRPAQKKIATRMHEILREMKMQDKFKVDTTTIATDIENNHVGKHFAIKRIQEWLKSRRITITNYKTFGDSFSDITMAEELHSQGLKVEFIYVGNGKIDQRKYAFKVINTSSKFEKGAFEYLSSY